MIDSNKLFKYINSIEDKEEIIDEYKDVSVLTGLSSEEIQNILLDGGIIQNVLHEQSEG